MSGLLDRRLVYVTGKGGVGKSTVAAALGLLAARQGRRTIIAEVAAQDRIARVFGRSRGSWDEVALADGLHAISIDQQKALEEYLKLQIRVKPLADALASSRLFQYFQAATPGMRELLTIGKVWELSQPERKTRQAGYDLVIVDAPSSGHGIATLRAAKTFADIDRVGPVAHQGRTIHEMLRDPARTAVVAVALPEEMPVNETFMLRDELRERMDRALDAVVLNGLYPERFDEDDTRRLTAALDDADGPPARTALGAALSERRRSEGQRAQLERLREGIGTDPIVLPFVFEPELGVPELEALSRTLEQAL